MTPTDESGLAAIAWQPATLALDEALQHAIACHRQGELDVAEGLALLGQHRSAEAFEAAVQAELLLPAESRRRESYGRALMAAGEHEHAVAFYRDWLAKDPASAYARHHLAACLGETPARASDAYVEQVFDQFAAGFDAHLYFGDLAPMFIAARGALRTGGTLVFTLEALAEDDAADFRLMESGRYAHGLAGLRANLAQAGLAEKTVAPASPRHEGGQPVPGWTVTVGRS